MSSDNGIPALLRLSEEHHLPPQTGFDPLQTPQCLHTHDGSQLTKTLHHPLTRPVKSPLRSSSASLSINEESAQNTVIQPVKSTIAITPARDSITVSPPVVSINEGSAQNTIIQPVKSTIAITPARDSVTVSPPVVSGSSAQTTIVQPVMSTMKIESSSSSPIQTPRTSSFNSVLKRPSSDSASSFDQDLLAAEEELVKLSSKKIPTSPTSSTAFGTSSNTIRDNHSPPLSPNLDRIQSFGMASDILASSAAILSRIETRNNSYSLVDTTDDLLVQLLISQAIVDSKDFAILNLEDVEELKKEHSLLTNRMNALANKLALESKIREAASSLARLHASNKRLSRQAGDHLSQANRKVDQVTTELWKLSQRASEVERKLFHHMSGVLSLGIKKLEEKQTQSPQQQQMFMDPGRNGIENLYNEIMGMENMTSDNELTNKVTNLESSLQNAHQTLADARMSIRRKDKEIEELKSKVDDAVSEARERTIAELRTELEEVGSRLDIVLRKHKAAKKDAFPDDNDTEASEESDEGPNNRLSTMTTATQHLQKEQYRNISKNLSSLEKSLEEYQFRIYKLDQDLTAVKNKTEKDMDQQKESQQKELKAEKAKRESLEKQLIELKFKSRNNEDLEEQVKQLQVRQSNTNADLQEQLKKITQEYELVIEGLKELFKNLPEKLTKKMEATNFTVDNFISLVHQIGEENGQLLDEISQLQIKCGNIQEVGDEKEKLKEILQSTQLELEETKLKYEDLELRAQNAKNNLTQFSEKETELRNEVTQLHTEIDAYKEKIRKHEAILKRQSVIAVVQDGKSIKEEFQQQLASQEQEYEAQLKERDGVITRLRSDYNNAITEKNNSAQTVKELEEMLSSKSRTLDQREVTINRLEADIVQLKMELAELKTASDGLKGKKATAAMFGNALNSNEINSLRSQLDAAHEEINNLRSANLDLQLKVEHLSKNMATVQSRFSAREEALENRSDMLQNELDGISLEFERLTKNFLDFDTERNKLQATIDKLNRQCEKLDDALADERIKNLGNNPKEPLNTAGLRKEFRTMMSNLRSEHAKALQRENEEKRLLDNLVRSLRREKEAEKWVKVNKSTQTRFVVSVKSG
ncbi:7438_t:CDS:2 [Ambispora gerdemannii]|uniref:7438_t:CDS:1 n=1 Tax=Ambispora gerdemannii TaxID=144530 RepID=A0A9N8VFN6_9GLOM|nr:7438_t:CDS:2 [Ambispora gerdemannii]